MKKLILVCLLLFSNAVNAITLEFTEKELQEKISAMMPIERKKLFVTVVITNPILKLLKNENKLNITSNVAAKMPGGLKGEGEVNITGGLFYVKEKGEFYLKEPVINDMHIKNVPDKFQGKIKEITQKTLTKTLKTKPVYKLKDDNIKQKLAKSTLKSIIVKDGILVVEFSLF